ncbi:hypothetical protein C9374_001637 [Naegleria lovaniensis]|uniref:Uncharacterized protein n=1 Tax=Naegleria lovaniensis TaxID=51637 RepID=A0AA88GR19_NAELO|nr:uncharacterized protein C9374_001637 [Naegleria lovaniensis]KAG2387305.1 hypothetical protein C9374_001637 [Naegleria lovaniensis]
MPSTPEELFLPKANDSNENEMDVSIGEVSDRSSTSSFTLFDIGLIKLAEEVASFVLAHGKAKSTKVIFKLFQSIQNKSDQEQLANTFIQIQQQTKHETVVSSSTRDVFAHPSTPSSSSSVTSLQNSTNLKKKSQPSPCINKRKQTSSSHATDDESIEGNDEDGKKKRAGKRAPPQKTNEDKEKYWSTHFQTMYTKSLPENFTLEQFKESLSEKNSEPAFVTYGFLTKSQTEAVKKSTFKFFHHYPRLFYLMSYTPLIQYGAAVASEWLESHPAYKAHFVNLPSQYLTIDKLFPAMVEKYLD